MYPDYTNFQSVLEWLAGVGGSYAVGVLVAWLVENWPKWHTLPRLVKFFLPMLAAVLISIGAVLLMQQTEFVSQVSPWFRLIAQTVIAYLGTQGGYMQAKQAGYAFRSRSDALQSYAGKCCEEEAETEVK